MFEYEKLRYETPEKNESASVIFDVNQETMRVNIYVFFQKLSLSQFDQTCHEVDNYLSTSFTVINS